VGGALDVVGGPALYQVARLVATLHGGQLVLSDRAWRAVDGLLGDVRIDDLGLHRLIGVKGLSRLVQVQPPQLVGRVFEQPLTLDVVRSNAPPVRASFLGRDGDLQALAELASFGLRVVTLTGVPGVGRSGFLPRYLAIHGEAYTKAGAGGAWYCRVEGVGLEHVLGAVAASVGLSLRFGRDTDALIRQVGAALRRRGRVLMAVDAVLVNPASLAEALSMWMAIAPESRWVVAARCGLGLPGEVTYELGPLPRVDLDSPRNGDAVRLFVDRAHRAVPSFQPREPLKLAELCNHLGGNPLAIGLAAGLVGHLTIDELLSAVLLSDGTPDAVLQLVWGHLDDVERQVLSGCAVYPGGFDRLGAEAVVDPAATGINSAEVLTHLVRRGLVHESDDPRTPEVRRYVMHRRIRHRALAPVAPEAVRALQRRSADRILQLCQPLAQNAWGEDGTEVLGRLTVEWANLAGVALWAQASDAEAEDVDRGLRAAATLWPLVSTAGPAGLFVDMLTPLLERADAVLGADPVEQARALYARAEAQRFVGDSSAALVDAERGAEVAQRWGEQRVEGLARLSLGASLNDRGRREQAIVELQRAEVLFNEAGEPADGALAAAEMSRIALDLGNFDEAEELICRAIRVLRDHGRTRHCARALITQGRLMRRTGKSEQARSVYAEAARIHREVGDLRALAVCLLNAGSLELRDGQIEAAKEALTDALPAAQDTGDLVVEARILGTLGLQQLAVGATDAGRDYLLGALAIERDRGDSLGEAATSGYIAVSQQLEGKAGAAAAAYRRSLEIMESRGTPRLRATFYAWLGALEAEQLNEEACRAALDRALVEANASSEPAAVAQVRVLEGAWHLLRAREDRSHRRLARRVYQRTEDSRDVDVVLARRRLGFLIESGLTVEG
jgi:tetratricopeptide (TPR) repeat protein